MSRAHGITRRQLLHTAGAGAAGALLAVPARAAAASPKKGGRLLVGCAGGGAKDRIDAHNPISYPDIARVFALYEPLAMRSADYKFELVLAEEFSPNRTADLWTVRLKPGIEFHNGKTLTAEDAIFSIRRIINPKNPGAGAAGLSDIDPQGLRKLDERTFEIRLKSPFATFGRSR